MIDINLIRTNPDLVRENIKKKFQDEKLPLVDEVIALDKQNREAIQRADYLRSQRNKISKMIGGLMAKGQKEEAEAAKQQVKDMQDELAALEVKEEELAAEVKKRMMVIPNIIDPSVPIGKDDSENVENERFGEPVVPDFEVPYHVDIMEKLDGIDLDAARRTSGNGFYYLKGDIARLHSAILSYARDFMIDRGFTYYIPPFMIRSSVVNGVMSFAEMENMMYKIEGEDLYLIGTSEHSMIGKFIDTILDEKDLPQTLTSYSPCFRKEVGAHGIEERGVYRIHQFEKQEMIVVCKPEDSMMWYERLWKNTVDFFRTLDIPVRTLECCSGDLADLKVKSCDVEAWSPRQQKYFEVGSCSPGPHPEQHRGRTAAHADRLPGEQPAGRRPRAHPRGIAHVYGRQGVSRINSHNSTGMRPACRFLLIRRSTSDERPALCLCLHLIHPHFRFRIGTAAVSAPEPSHFLCLYPRNSLFHRAFSLHVAHDGFQPFVGIDDLGLQNQRLRNRIHALNPQHHVPDERAVRLLLPCRGTRLPRNLLALRRERAQAHTHQLLAQRLVAIAHVQRALETAAVDFCRDHAPSLARVPGNQPQLRASIAVPDLKGDLHHPVASAQLNREHAGQHLRRSVRIRHAAAVLPADASVREEVIGGTEILPLRVQHPQIGRKRHALRIRCGHKVRHHGEAATRPGGLLDGDHRAACGLQAGHIALNDRLRTLRRHDGVSGHAVVEVKDAEARAHGQRHARQQQQRRCRDQDSPRQMLLPHSVHMRVLRPTDLRKRSVHRMDEVRRDRRHRALKVPAIHLRTSSTVSSSHRRRCRPLRSRHFTVVSGRRRIPAIS